MAKSDFYDPATMVVKDIGELVAELNKLIMPKLPGGRDRQAVWAILCEASRIYSFAEGVIADDEEKAKPDSFIWKTYGEHYAAATIIRKLADALGVSNFKNREIADGPDGGPGQPAGHG